MPGRAGRRMIVRRPCETRLTASSGRPASMSAPPAIRCALAESGCGGRGGREHAVRSADHALEYCRYEVRRGRARGSAPPSRRPAAREARSRPAPAPATSARPRRLARRGAARRRWCRWARPGSRPGRWRRRYQGRRTGRSGRPCGSARRMRGQGQDGGGRGEEHRVERAT